MWQFALMFYVLLCIVHVLFMCACLKRYGLRYVQKILCYIYYCYNLLSWLFFVDQDGETRDLRQYHYTKWPDMGVPDCPAPVLNFIKRVNDYVPEDAGPPIIHCRWGRRGFTITGVATAILKSLRSGGKWWWMWIRNVTIVNRGCSSVSQRPLRNILQARPNVS